METLTKKQLGRLKDALLERQRMLTSEVRAKREQAAEEAREDTMGVADTGDESVLRMQADLDLQEAGRDLEELQQIDAALRRMDDGTYGECVECGTDIEYARLEAQPTAMRCIDCQSQHERTYATKGMPTL
ncbi:MAG: TraR/DksA family transcriptional regulator [Burkholderiales bacterium]